MYKDGTVSFKAEHLLALTKEPANKHLEEWFNNGLVYHLEKGESVTFIHNGRVHVCGGINPYWHGRGQLWTVFSENIKDDFVPTFRAIKRWLKHQIDNNYQRIELSIDADFPPGRRRADLLGFVMECELARKYLPNGKDCSLYSLVRGG